MSSENPFESARGGIKDAVGKAMDSKFKKSSQAQDPHGPQAPFDINEMEKFVKAMSNAGSPNPSMPQNAEEKATGMTTGEVRLVIGKNDNKDHIGRIIAHAQAVLEDGEILSRIDNEGYNVLEIQQASHILGNITFSTVQPLSNEEMLISEMGKLYRQRYDLAKEANDEKQINRAWGAMQALKKVQDMFEGHE